GRRRREILRNQSQHFSVGAELANDAAVYGRLEERCMIVTPDFTGRVQSEIVDLVRRVPLPDAFVIPGGTPAAAALDVARAVVRRAERRIVGLQQGGQLRNPEVLRYANRLSDLLFMLARPEAGTAVKPLTGRRAGRRPPTPARTRPALRRRSRA